MSEPPSVIDDPLIVRIRSLKHLALQVATMLPENPSEARAVLDLVRELVEWTEAESPRAAVLMLHPEP
jgi:hypothetical protein